MKVKNYNLQKNNLQFLHCQFGKFANDLKLFSLKSKGCGFNITIWMVIQNDRLTIFVKVFKEKVQPTTQDQKKDSQDPNMLVQ